MQLTWAVYNFKGKPNPLVELVLAHQHILKYVLSPDFCPNYTFIT